MTDEELLRAMAAGDRDALSVLYRRHSPWLGARLMSAAVSRDLAEEALQDTWLAAWKSAGKYRGEGDVGAWLWGIARRRLVSLARRRRVTIATYAASGVPPAGADPAESSVAGDEARRLREAVARLPIDQRVAVEGVHFEGRSVAEVAFESGVSSGTVKSRLYRARARLRTEYRR
jgi:RNA polymerase sigma-70 factor (ECF subfamily)